MTSEELYRKLQEKKFIISGPCVIENESMIMYLAENIKKLADKSITSLGRKADIIKVVDRGKRPEICDIIINTTSVGLKKDENLDLNFEDYENNKNALFYDLIYNPKETNFLKEARLRGNKTINGKKMFLWQAQIAFQMWTGVDAKVNNEVIKILEK